MYLEDNERLARRYFETASAADDWYRDEIVASDFEIRAIHGRYTSVVNPGDAALCGPAMVQYFNQEWRTVWDDPQASLDEIVGEGIRLIVQWTFRGVQVGASLGVPPMGKRFTFAGFSIFCVADGRLAEGWDMMDRVPIFQQLGVLPPTREIRQGRAMPAATAPSSE